MTDEDQNGEPAESVTAEVYFSEQYQVYLFAGHFDKFDDYVVSVEITHLKDLQPEDISDLNRTAKILDAQSRLSISVTSEGVIVTDKVTQTVTSFPVERFVRSVRNDIKKKQAEALIPKLC